MLLHRRRKIKMIESNAKKCRYLKKLTCKGTLRLVFYLSEAPNPPLTCTVYVYTVQYTYSQREGGWANQQVIGAIVHKAGRKYQHI
jgi:hypothetical protein